MNYIFAPEFVSKRQHLFSEVGKAIGGETRLEMFHDMEAFSAKLRHFNSPEIIVILAVGKKDMSNLLSIHKLFREAAVIIMLSDEEPATISSAIRMRPKFVGVMDSDLDKIVPIVKKIVRNRKTKWLETR